tara:strand:+ start:566 stop:4396 length:3831 start_codon:yes stop_codon:yes gene_type:complete
MTNDPKKIQGSGGTGGGRAAMVTAAARIQAPDNLDSRQFATFLDLLSEGEIEGFATASKENRAHGTVVYNRASLKDVFLNDTPILRASANSAYPEPLDFNFKLENVDRTIDSRLGTNNQPKMAGIESSSSITPVGVTVTQAAPVTRQITNSNVDAIVVTITIPQLQEARDNGDLLGSIVELVISVQGNSGGFVNMTSDLIKGRTADAYQKEYRIDLRDAQGNPRFAFPLDIKVTRANADNPNESVQNSFQWTSFAEIVNDQNQYLNSAYSSLRFDSKHFNSIPSRKFRLRGIKVRIPGAGALNSGTPTVDSATGRIIYPDGYIFNGVMGAAQWCSCPAMVLLDILTDFRYGLGNHLSPNYNSSSPSDADLYENIDLFSFVTASKFSNTLVSDGAAGQEARFSCNVSIQSSSEAFDIINELAGVMRCMPIWSAGTLSLSQDSPKDPSYLFSLANVTEAGFSYSGSSLKTRHTVINVSYFNMDSRQIDFETVEDDAAIAKFGIIVKQVKAFACTSRGQAIRLGKSILFAEQNESEVVTFTTSIDSGVIVRPGAVIEIADPVRSGKRRGGRIAAASITGIVADDDANTDLTSADSAEISVIMPDGSLQTRPIRTSGGIVGKSINLVIGQEFSAVPNVNAPFVISNTTTETQLFRVISVEESDGINYTITALSYVNEKYNSIEDPNFILPERNVSILSAIKEPPSSLTAQEKIVVINNQAVSKLIITWQPVVGVTEYRVNYKFNNNNFISNNTFGPDFEIFNTDAGTYEIEVFSYNAGGEPSATSTSTTVTTIGKTALPSDPSGLTAEPVSENFIRLRFNAATDIDVINGGSVAIRHTSSINPANNSFANSQEIIPKIPGNSTEALVPALSGTYSIKFIDDGGRRSTNAAKIIVSQPDSQPNQVIITVRDDDDNPSFQGNKVGTVVSPANVFDGLILDGDHSWDSIPDVDAIPAPINGVGGIDVSGQVRGFGTYDFAAKIDLGAIFNLTLKRIFVTRGLRLDELIDEVLFDAANPNNTGIDGLDDFDGTVAENVNAELLVATTLAGMDPNTTVQATYSQSDGSGGNGTFVTIFKAGHGYSVGDFVEINFTADSQGRKPQNNFYRIEQKDTNDAFVVISDLNQTVTNGTACSYGARFSQFNTFANGEFTARGFAIRAELASQNVNENIVVDDLGFEASVKRRTETVNTPIAAGTSAKTVTFQSPFFVGTSLLGGSTSAFLPSIGITLQSSPSPRSQNLVAGDYFKITSITSTQFVIEVKDVNNNFKDLDFKYIAMGYGKGS